MDCGVPPKLENGAANFTDTKNGSSAVYSCGAGFRLMGDADSICLMGRWTGYRICGSESTSPMSSAYDYSCDVF